MPQIQTRNPATKEPLETYDLMTKQEAFATIDAAHDAYQGWGQRSHEDRAPVLRSIAEVLRDNTDRLSELITRETGKLLRDGRTEMELCARLFEYTADNGPDELADEERKHSGGKKRGIVTYSPIGVIYSVQPWNFPLYQPVRVLAANAMAGNAVILKHASICTGSGLLLRDLCLEAGLPKGLFDVVLVDHDVSDEIIEHEKIRAVTMTGSDGAGAHIGKTAAAALKKTVLELGSNDAYLVLEDADIELAVKTSVKGRFYNNAETCVSAKRFVVTDAVYDRFIKAFVEQMQAITTGDPTDENTQLGPVSSEEQFETLVEQVSKSVKAGCTLLCGGDPNMPFGGVKNSGYGREHGGFGMKEFVNTKAIFLP
ncbi:MAG: aldehyde dehydrogenase family protein [Pseudomonadota bacterium]